MENHQEHFAGPAEGEGVEQLWMEIEKEKNIRYIHFEDTGTFYADQAMVENNLTMSMNTRLVYDISDAEDVRIVKKATDVFFAIAQKDIADDGPCFFGSASVFMDDVLIRKLIWEY